MFRLQLVITWQHESQVLTNTHQTRAKGSFARRIGDVANVRHIIQFFCSHTKKEKNEKIPHKLNRWFSSLNFEIAEISYSSHHQHFIWYQSATELSFLSRARLWSLIWKWLISGNSLRLFFSRIVVSSSSGDLWDFPPTDWEACWFAHLLGNLDYNSLLWILSEQRFNLDFH